MMLLTCPWLWFVPVAWQGCLAGVANDLSWSSRGASRSDPGRDCTGKAGRGKHCSLLTVHVPSGVRNEWKAGFWMYITVISRVVVNMPAFSSEEQLTNDFQEASFLWRVRIKQHSSAVILTGFFLLTYGNLNIGSIFLKNAHNGNMHTFVYNWKVEPLNSIPGLGLIWVNKKPWFEKAGILPSAYLFSQQGPKLAVCVQAQRTSRYGRGREKPWPPRSFPSLWPHRCTYRQNAGQGFGVLRKWKFC